MGEAVMSEARKKMLEKVKAILAKTMANGCTEEEAMTALAKARELMAAYDIDESELKEATEKTTTFATAPSDPYEIKFGLCVNVGKFTNCKAFRDLSKVINFAGKESDIVFATWLLDTLQRFVMRALRHYQADRAKLRLGNNNHTSASFVLGCINRINDKLAELAPITWATTQALIVKELNLDLAKGRARGKEVSKHAYEAGTKAGGNATFNRPVGAGGSLLLK